MNNQHLPFNWPHMTGKELTYISEAHFNGCLAGDGPFTKKCHVWLEEHTGAKKVLTNAFLYSGSRNGRLIAQYYAG
jgi:dTDP-4-amino-4,6-dideoxygalactose transaminase